MDSSRKKPSPRSSAAAAAWVAFPGFTGGTFLPDATPRRRRYDVLVCGARCAGAATAMLLSRAGLSVLLVDREAPGSDTLSTHALMRSGVLQLQRWGLLHGIFRSAARIERTTFHYGKQALEFEIRPKHGVDALYAPRRMLLDPLLQRAAVAAGAELLHGVSLTGLLYEQNSVVGARLRNRSSGVCDVSAQWVIGADGRRSKVAELVHAPVEHRGKHASATVYGYFSGFENRGNEWYYARGVAAGVIPTARGQACVFASMPSRDFRRWLRNGKRQALVEVLELLAPDVARRLPASGESLRAFAGADSFLKTASGPGWALVGDAGYTKDPITAHGISDALRDAELLAGSVLRGDTAAAGGYQAERDALSRELMHLTDAVASFEWDLEELGQLHRQLSREMNRESELIASWPSLPNVWASTHRVA